MLLAVLQLDHQPPHRQQLQVAAQVYHCQKNQRLRLGRWLPPLQQQLLLQRSAALPLLRCRRPLLALLRRVHLLLLV
jgi:hypothetical protein